MLAAAIIQTTPVKVIDNVAATSAGSSHSVAVKSDGSIWSFGSNTKGQIGNGGVGDKKTWDDYTLKTVPVKIIDGAESPVKTNSPVSISATKSDSTVLVNDKIIAFQSNLVLAIIQLQQPLL